VRSSRNSLLIDSLDCGCGQIELLLDLFDNRLQALNFTMPTIHELAWLVITRTVLAFLKGPYSAGS